MEEKASYSRCKACYSTTDAKPATEARNVAEYACKMSQNTLIGLFWDIENCHAPKGVSTKLVAEQLCNTFITEQGWEAEFMCVLDTKKESEKVVSDLIDADVTIIHIQATYKNACDMKIISRMNTFVKSHKMSARVILIANTFITEQGWEAEFMCVLDTKKESEKVVSDLIDADVTIIQIQATYKNACDMKIISRMNTFVKSHKMSARVILIANDGDFSDTLYQFKLNERIKIFVVHGPQVNHSLIDQADETFLFGTIIKGLPVENINAKGVPKRNSLPNRTNILSKRKRKARNFVKTRRIRKNKIGLHLQDTISTYLDFNFTVAEQDLHEFLVVLMEKLHTELNEKSVGHVPKLDSCDENLYWLNHKQHRSSKLSDGAFEVNSNMPLLQNKFKKI